MQGGGEKRPRVLAPEGPPFPDDFGDAVGGSAEEREQRAGEAIMGELPGVGGRPSEFRNLWNETRPFSRREWTIPTDVVLLSGISVLKNTEIRRNGAQYRISHSKLQ